MDMIKDDADSVSIIDNSKLNYRGDYLQELSAILEAIEKNAGMPQWAEATGNPRNLAGYARKAKRTTSAIGLAVTEGSRDPSSVWISFTAAKLQATFKPLGHGIKWQTIFVNSRT